MHTNFVVVQSFSRCRLFAWTAASQASRSFTIYQSLPKLMSIESVMLYNHLTLCYPLLLLPSVFPCLEVFSNELAPRIRLSKYWSFSFSISPSNEYSGLISFSWLVWSCCPRGSRVFFSTTVWKHQFFGAQPSLWAKFHNTIWPLEKP